ncbi:MAG: DUF624 domain-containing protein [Butyrivibrio sp.]|nr:DUF624 domain-containing protein [Butyrivibrio sp.]
MKIFDIDSPFMRFLTKFADLMILNIATIIFCVPSLIVGYAILSVYLDYGTISLLVVLILLLVSFPIGAALTGMHYVLLKMVRDEESYILKSFWKSFRENFKQATALWYIVAGVATVLLVDLWYMSKSSASFPLLFRYILVAVSLVLYMFSLYIFPLQSKFVNPVKNTLKNSALMAIMALPKTLLMFGINVVVLLLLYFFEGQMVPVILVLGLSGPGFLHALLYNKTFKKFEPEDEDAHLSEEEELNRAISRMDEASDDGNSNNE